MIEAQLDQLGCAHEKLIVRLGDSESLHDAWERATVPSDLAWLAFRIAIESERIALVGIAFAQLGISVLKGNGLPHSAISVMGTLLSNADIDAVKKMASLQQAVLNDGIGRKILLNLDGNLLHDTRGHDHIFAMQLLGALVLLYVGKNENAANAAALGTEVLDKRDEVPSFVQYLREGIPFDLMIQSWQLLQRVPAYGSGNA